MKHLVISVAIAASLAGCSTMVEIREDARTSQSQAQVQAEAMLAQRANAARPATGAIITDAPYVDVRAMRRATRYPASFSRTVTMNEPSGIPLDALVQRVQAMTGVAVMYQPEITRNEVAVAGGAQQESTVSSDASGLPSLSALLPKVQSRSSSSVVPVAYSGDVTGLFNAIAAAVGASWEYDDVSRKVTLYKYATQTFRVPAVQGAANSTASVGGANQTSWQSGEQNMSNATATGNYTADASIWRDLDDAMKKMVSSEGVYTISQATGAITVRDRPDRVEQVRKYLDNTVAIMSRQVDVELTIYRVLSKDNDTRALNWKALFQSAAGKYGIALDTLAGRPATEGGTNLTVTIPDTNGKWGGSQIVMDALSTLGKTSVEQSTSIVTSNNTPAPFKVVRRTSYLKELSQGMTASGGAQYNTGPTLTPGVVETGLNVYVVPNVMEDGKRVKLRVMASISTLEGMNKIGTDQAFIQVPDTASREFQSEAWLKSGETLVLAGFQQTDSGLTTTSPLDKRLWLLGGSSKASKSREIVVIALRPVVSAIRSKI